jgi:DNA polymerase-3 subunit alpha
LVKEYQDIFGHENFYLEIMFNKHIEGLETINADYKKLSEKTGAPLVATQNCHYLVPEDREAFDTLLGVSTSGSKIGSGFMQGDFHFADTDEMIEKFKDYPDAIMNTLRIANQCKIEIDIDSWYFPDIEIPTGYNYDDYLKKITYEGIEKRHMEQTPELEQRIEYELNIIKSKGYSSYFLIMADLVSAAKEMGIYTIQGVLQRDLWYHI